MTTKLQKMRESAGLTIMELAQKICPVGCYRFGNSDYRDIMIAISFHEQGYESGISALWADIAKALNCKKEDLIDD